MALLPPAPLAASTRRCDSRWGSASMGESDALQHRTLCSDGSAVTSVAMALAGLGSVIANAAARPDSVNSWLQSSAACVADNCNDLELTPASLVPGSPLQYVGKRFSPDPEVLASALEDGNAVLIGEPMRGWRAGPQTLPC